jgi:hypothetical protein
MLRLVRHAAHIDRCGTHLQNKHGVDEVADVVKIQWNLWTVNFKDAEQRSSRFKQLTWNV